MPVRLLLVRHGQSTWNAEGRWQGRADPPLSQLGVRQARQAAETLGVFDLIASSSLQRAHSTASIIAEALGVSPVVTDPDLGERHAGAFEGLTRDEIEARWPGWLAERRRPEDYEDDESVTQRAVGALARLVADLGDRDTGDEATALVVSHGGVIGALERLVGATREGRLANLGGRWFEIGPGVLRAGDAVVLLDHDTVTVPGQI